jgi:hypothetical protein
MLESRILWDIVAINFLYIFIIYLISNQNLQLFYKLMCYSRANKLDNDSMGTLLLKEPPEIHLRSIGRRIFSL